MKPEILLTCPVCHNRGFTARGLRAHWCRSKAPLPGSGRKGAPLSQHELIRARETNTDAPVVNRQSEVGNPQPQ